MKSISISKKNWEQVNIGSTIVYQNQKELKKGEIVMINTGDRKNQKKYLGEIKKNRYFKSPEEIPGTGDLTHKRKIHESSDGNFVEIEIKKRIAKCCK